MTLGCYRGSIASFVDIFLPRKAFLGYHLLSASEWLTYP